MSLFTCVRLESCFLLDGGRIRDWKAGVLGLVLLSVREGTYAELPVCKSRSFTVLER